MDKEKDLAKKRFTELWDRSYREGRYTFTEFLSLAELSDFYEMSQSIPGNSYTVFGGYDDAERVIIRFGNEDELGYLQEFPISIIEISPLIDKFAEDLSHRDFLGALMNLGIEREKLGDILLKGKAAFLFCNESMADYIVENLTRVKHTTVKSQIITELPAIAKTIPMEKIIQVASSRIDAVIAHAYNLSRGAAIEYFDAKKVFVNGRLCENNSYMVKPMDRISVRGLGRVIYKEMTGTSRRGKENVKILM